MSEFTTGIPILTLLTVLPLVGAALALVAGRHARAVALVTTLAACRWRSWCGRNCRRMGESASSSSALGRRRWASSIIWAWTGWAR